MNKSDITRYTKNLERALTSMFADSRIQAYLIDDMRVSRQGDVFYICINSEIPTCD